MTLKFKNNASTTLSGSINNTQTSITVISGSNFPVVSGSDAFYATMYELSGAVEINIEIVKVTATSGNVWTIERGLDGTTTRSRNGVATCYIELRLTAAGAGEMLQLSNNLSDLASAATARTNLGLGSMATQNANAVAITGGTMSGVTIDSVDSGTSIADNIDASKKLMFELSGIATATTRTLTVPDASGTIALVSNLTAGYQPLDADLTALAALSTTGLMTRTGAGTVAVRSLTAPAAGITVSNGDGVSGNPTLALANDLAAAEALSTTGFVRRTAADTWSASAIVDADLPTALTGKTYNALSLTANTTGFTIAGGTTSKAVQFNNNITIAGTDGTIITLPAINGTVALNNQALFIGTTSVAINRTTGALALTGVSIDGAAGSASTAGSATKASNLAGGNATTLLGAIGYQSALDTTTLLAPNTSATKQFLAQTGTGTNGAAPTWSTLTKSDVGLGSVENTALSTWTGANTIATVGTITTGTWSGNAIPVAYGGTGASTKAAGYNALTPITTLGDLPYHDGTNGVRLAGNTTTTRRFLRQTGTGTVSAAPAWDTLLDADIPNLTGKTYNALTLTAASIGFTLAGGATSKTLTVSNTLTLAGTDASTLNIGTGGTLGTAAFTASTTYAPAAGSTSVTTLGTVTAGTWNASTIGLSYGGTGQISKTASYNALTPMSTLGDLSYHDGTNGVRLPGNTVAAKRFLTQTGTGTVSAAPGWNSLVDGDLPSALAGKTYNALSLTAASIGFTVSGGTTSKTLTVNNTIALSGTDTATLNIGGGGTLGTAAFTASTAYQPADADLTAIAGLTGTAGFLKKTAADTWALDTTTYQPSDADLTAIAGLAGTTGLLRKTAADTWVLDTAAYATSTGSTGITTVGTVTTGTWNATAIGIAYGGTGAITKAAAFDALSPLSALGDVPYHDGTNNVRLAGNTSTTRRFLTQTGNGTASAAPAWNAIVDGDLPGALTGKTYNGLTVTTSTGVLTVASAKTLTVNNTLTLAGTDGSTLNVGGGGTLGTAAFTASTAYQSADADLAAIAALAGTSGFLKKTAADTWALDTNTYLTTNQSISVTGDATGSGSTSIALTLANSGATAGTYKSVTVDAKGRVTGGTNPTTLAGYGITDLASDITVAGYVGIGLGGGARNSNTRVGSSALEANTTGTQSSAFGSGALREFRSGSNNTGVGFSALQGFVEYDFLDNIVSTPTGSNNTAVGQGAAVNIMQAASNNTAIGSGALSGQSTGNNNTALGYLAGSGITTGSGNTILGANVTGLAAALTNNIILANGTGAIKAQHDNTNWSVSGGFLPATDTTQTLGSAAKRWSEVRATNFYGSGANLTGVAAENVTGNSSSNVSIAAANVSTGNGYAVNITSGGSSASSGYSGAVSITTPGASNSIGGAGDITLAPGAGGTNVGNGGSIYLTAGERKTSTGSAGNVLISGGASSASNAAAGTATIRGGAGTSTTSPGGAAIIQGGAGSSGVVAGAGGAVTITGGASGSNATGSGGGGAVNITGGSANTLNASGTPGAVNISGGAPQLAGQAGANVNITASSGFAASTAANGGSVVITSGTGTYLGATSGDIRLVLGSGTYQGRVDFNTGSHTAAGSVACTMPTSAGPTGIAGGAVAGWLTIKISGTLSYIPYWR